MELAPVSLYLPATHSSQVLVESSASCMNSPGPQKSHLDAPALLKPVPHDEHVSTEPVLYVPASHASSSVRSSLALWPGRAGVHVAAPEREKVPRASQGAHVSLPPSEYVEAAQGTHALEVASALFPGLQ